MKFIDYKIPAIATLLPVFLFSSGCQSKSERSPLPEKPNIVLIYVDDMGFGDLSLTGAYGYETPNLEKMAKDGMFFSHFYAPQAVCSPSRAGLLTGTYPSRIGFGRNVGPGSMRGLNQNEETIADILKEQGYATAIYGKWHLGHHPPFLPTRHGFDEYYGIPYSNDMWPYHPDGPDRFPDLPLFENEEIINPAVTPEDQEQFTTEFTERTVEFIRDNRDQPFFVYLPHPQPHVPLFVSEKFKGKSEEGLYGDVMMELDWSVGRINDTLEELGLAENTLVIFTSDNGPWLNYGNHAGSAGGLREGKANIFEGGQRVPALMKWKGVIPPGTVCNNITSAIDLLPTIASIAQAPLPEKKNDVINILSLLRGDFEENPRDTFYYYYSENILRAVRKGDWKLVFAHTWRTYEGFEPGKDGLPGEVDNNHSFETGLYNLRRDPGERYNLIDYYPEVVEELEQVASVAREDLGDDLTGNPGNNRREAGRINQ